MEPIYIDIRQGWHSAAGMSDATVRLMLNLAIAELAIRCDIEEFEESIVKAFEDRFANKEFLSRLRKERDLMDFAAEVMADIQSLPVA